MNYKEIDFKMLPDNELLAFWDMLRAEAKQLMTDIDEYANGKRQKRMDIIKEEYARQKDRIRFMWDYLVKARNYEGFSDHYVSFRSNAMEAAAFGFDMRKGHKVDRDLYQAVEEAHYKLGKSYPKSH